jgi:hypothetical protein
MKKNFITTVDKEIADKLISVGFQLVSQSGTSYIFLNQFPKNFTFDEVDVKKICYTDIINI